MTFKIGSSLLLLLLLSLLLLTACDLASQSTTSVPTATVDSASLVEGTRQAIDRLTPENHTPTPSITPTPYQFSIVPSPTSICETTLRTRLILQERGQVLDDDPRQLRMRSEPGTDKAIVAQIPINAVFLVLEGPVCEEQYAWFLVRYRDKEGWIAEGDNEQYYVQPYLPG